MFKSILYTVQYGMILQTKSINNICLLVIFFLRGARWCYYRGPSTVIGNRKIYSFISYYNLMTFFSLLSFGSLLFIFFVLKNEWIYDIGVLFFQTFHSCSRRLRAVLYMRRSSNTDTIIIEYGLSLVFYVFAFDENVTSPLSENVLQGRDARQGYAKLLRRSNKPIACSFPLSRRFLQFCSSLSLITAALFQETFFYIHRTVLSIRTSISFHHCSSF